MYCSGMYAVIILLMAYITASASLTSSPFLSKVVARAILSITSAMYTRKNDTYIEDLPSFMMYRRNDPATPTKQMDSTMATVKYAATEDVFWAPSEVGEDDFEADVGDGYAESEEEDEMFVRTLTVGGISADDNVFTAIEH